MQPTKERNHSGIHISYGSHNILFDCGEGIQRQLKIAGLKRSRITHICISHWHGDHALGIAGLLSTMGADQCQHTVMIYGPKGSRKKFNHLKKAFPSMNAATHKLIEVERGIVFDGDDFVIEAETLSHGIDCVGYALREKEKLKIDIKKARAKGLSQGPMLKEIQLGKSVCVEGKTIKAQDVTTKILGKKLAYVADTRPCIGARRLAKKSDVLIIESTFLFEDKKYALKFHHMTAKESAELAAKADAAKVYLTHPSQRYKDVSVLVREAKKFHKNVRFAKDFMEFEL